MLFLGFTFTSTCTSIDKNNAWFDLGRASHVFIVKKVYLTVFCCHA